MFKRFQVFDLLFGTEDTTPKEWIDVTCKLPNERNGVFRVKMSNNSECDAYYCSDKLMHLCGMIGADPTYWWNRYHKGPIYNVTHWGEKTELFTKKKPE